MTRFWYWFQPGLAIVVAVISLYTIVAVTVFEAAGVPSLQFAITGLFVFPGLLISLAVNQVILRRRRPMVITTAERVLMAVLAAVAALLIATSFDVEALLVGVWVWPLLILFAIAVTVVIAVTGSRLAAARAAPADSPPVPPTDHRTIDDLLG